METINTHFIEGIMIFIQTIRKNILNAMHAAMKVLIYAYIHKPSKKYKPSKKNIFS